MIRKRFDGLVETGSRSRILTYACVLGLIALALMSWALFGQGWIPIMMAMTLGQAIGTLSLALFILVIVIDLQRATFRPSIAPPPRKPEDD